MSPNMHASPWTENLSMSQRNWNRKTTCMRWRISHFGPRHILGNCMLLSCKGATNSLLPHYIHIGVPLRQPGVDGAAEAPVAMPASGCYISMLTAANRAAASSRYRSRACTRSLAPNEKVTAGGQSAHEHVGFKRRPAGKCPGTLGAAATPNRSCALDPEDGG